MPSSSRYGQYLTIEDIKDIVSPDTESLNNVRDFLSSQLKAYDISTHRYGDSITCKATVSMIEKTFGVNYSLFQRKDKPGKYLLRALMDYEMPNEIEKYVDFISGINDFARKK